MKVFQIVDDLCFSDVSYKYDTIEEARQSNPDMIFEEAPDYVFPGWGFDNTKTGDDRFIKPIPPEGFEYNDLTGTFRQLNYTPPESPTQKIARLEQQNALLTAQIQAVSDRNDFIEDCIAEMAMTVYNF